MRLHGTVIARATQLPEQTTRFPFILLGVAILLFPSPVRGLLFGEALRAVNVVAWLAMGLIVLSGKPRAEFRRIRGWSLLAGLGMSALVVYSTPLQGNQAILMDLAAYVLPVLILVYASGRAIEKSVLAFLPIWAWLLNFAVLVIAVGGIVDIFFDQTSSRFFAQLYGARSFQGLVSEGRMVSFYGHALTSAFIIMAAFCVNHLRVLLGSPRTASYLPVFYVLVMSMTTSKSGFIVILCAVLITSVRKGRVRIVLVTSIGLVAAYIFGILDTVLFRLDSGFRAGDISTGRNVALEELFGSGEKGFNLFSGQVFDSFNVALVAALEYPALRFAFRYGVLFSAVFAFLVFVRPAFQMLRQRTHGILMAWLAMTVFVNSYSGVASYGDVLLIQTITTVFALAASHASAQRLVELR